MSEREPPGSLRTILHVDMDAFFVACEVLRDPSLAGKAVVVGGSGERGVVAAASYEARRFGVHSAMPSVRARRLCPHALFLRGDHAWYSEISRRVHEVFTSVTPLVEPIALDEAFLDVTGAQRLLGTGAEIGWLLRTRIDAELGLSASVGVASTKFLAKLGSEAAKPRATPEGVRPGAGVFVVAPGSELAFLHPHPVEALWGVGPKTLERLARLGVRTVGDLAVLPVETVVGVVGRAHGAHLHALANGIDERPVEPDRALKSVGHEETFARDKHDHESLYVEVVRLADGVASRLRHHDRRGRTVVVKVRFGDFRTITRSVTLPGPVSAATDIARAARQLLEPIEVGAGVRLLGVSVTGLVGGDAASTQLTLGLDGDASERDATGDLTREEAASAVDEIRRRFGAEAIVPAVLVGKDGPRVVRKGDQPWGPDA